MACLFASKESVKGEEEVEGSNWWLSGESDLLEDVPLVLFLAKLQLLLLSFGPDLEPDPSDSAGGGGCFLPPKSRRKKPIMCYVMMSLVAD